MKEAWRITTDDWRRIGRSWTACVIIAGLALLPSLYAWFNILASWDPYGRTGRLPLAVVDLDRGQELKPAATAGAPDRLEAGREIVEALRGNRAIGWSFVSADAALAGVRDGTYYASLTIPEDFSEKLSTVLDAEPLRAEILYRVNDKLNAIAPKITASGASGMLQQFNEQFTGTVSEVLFRLLDRIGGELARDRPALERTEQLVYRLEREMPQIRQATVRAGKDLDRAAEVAAAAQKALPLLRGLAAKGGPAAAGAERYLQRSAELRRALAPAVRQSLLLAGQSAAPLADAAAALRAAAEPQGRTAEAAARLRAAAEQAEAGRAAAEALAALLPRLESGGGSGPLAAAGREAGALAERLAGTAEPLLGAAGALAAGAAPEAGLAERAAKAAELAGQTPARLLERFDSELLPRIEAASQRAETAVREASAALALASAELPKAEALLAEAERGVAFGKSKLGELSAELPAAERGIARLAAKLRELREQGSLEDAIRLLRSDYARKAAFLAKPVEIKTERLYPIATYGAAMTPFFTVLSIWVGALLLVSMLSTDVHLEPGEPAPGARSAYVGRLLTFAAVGLLQTLLAALGDLLLLGVDAASPLLFVLGSLGISLVFMTIVYTLVSLLGNVGKAAAIVLLVLQLAASGGTFPIQLTHPVFQAVYPFLPFTYASRLLREAVGGILPEAALRDALLLLAFGLAALAAGLLLKRRLNGIAARLAAKARESRIIH